MSEQERAAPRPDDTARLIIADSEHDSNLYFATKFLAPDPFVFLEHGGEKLLLMSDLEVDRARAQAAVDRVLSYSEYENRAKAAGAASPTMVETLSVLLRERQVTRLQVPANFPLIHADRLRAAGLTVEAQSEPFFPARLSKTPEEIAAITEAQQATESAADAAIALIANSRAKDGLLYARNGKRQSTEPLTSERIKQVINLKLMELGCVAQHTIVACGEQACDPHNEGSGPLRAGQPIILDIFPRSSSTRYFADMSRTVVKGKASDTQKQLYDLVLKGQEIAFAQIKAGADGQAIHEAIVASFEQAGFKTGLRNGRMEGFFHGTGHGVGLDIHEPPRISRTGARLEAGQVVTVEPGLYYPGVGAVRLEDMVVVTETGHINLTKYPKTLEV